MKLERAQPEERDDRESRLARRRTVLANAFSALPAYGSMAFWRAIEEPDIHAAVPLEVLVKCARIAIARADDEGRKRFLAVIFRCIHVTNEYWANAVLKGVPLQAGERHALVGDLYADLCECVIRAIMDTKRLFWEENFQHCLSFERKHVLRSTVFEEHGRLFIDAQRAL